MSNDEHPESLCGGRVVTVGGSKMQMWKALLTFSSNNLRHPMEKAPVLWLR